MKSVIATLFFLICFLFGSLIFANEVDSVQLRNSIFLELHNMESDKDKVSHLRNAVLNYMGRNWSLELLDTALVITRRAEMHHDELRVLFDIARHHQFARDRKKFDQSIQNLKVKSYEYEDYGLYFSAWAGAMQYYSSSGDTEYVIVEAQNMAREAERINYEQGISVVLITLGQALAYADRNPEAIDVYNNALNLGVVNRNGKMKLHHRLASLYRQQEEYDKALNELNQRVEILNELMGETPPENQNKYRSHWLETELAYCRVYAAQQNEQELYNHLMAAQKYYYPQCFYSMAVGYHAFWGEYYRMVKQWDKCFEMFDIALGMFRESDPLHRSSVCKMKIKALLDANRYEDAAGMYRYVVAKQDSLNVAVANRNEEIHRANFSIQEALVAKEKGFIARRISVGVIAILFIIVLIIAIVRSFRLRKRLRQSEDEIRQALFVAEASDKMKAHFLRNITYEVRIALNTVVGFSDILSVEKDLSQTECEEYSAMIKKNADALIVLINNVLDLSRLESGMMRFNWEEVDALQLCREAKMVAEMQNNRNIKMVFSTLDSNLLIRTDTRWFSKVLLSMLSGAQRKSTCNAECLVEEKSEKLIVTVCNCMFYHRDEDEQTVRISDTINTLFVKAAGGEYWHMKDDNGCEKTVVSYPLLR